MPRLVRVLLVEDDSVDVMTVERSLADRNVPASLEVAVSAEEAIARLDPKNAGLGLPDLVIADLRLPLLSGLDLLEHLKADARLRPIPVVLLSTSRHDRDVEHAYAAGAAGYFVKPVAFAKFADTVERVLGYWMLSEPDPRGAVE